MISVFKMMQNLTRRRLRFVWRYLRGDAPWDSGIVPPEIVTWVETAESDGLPPGRALDLGCGTGTTALYLAARGWDVVGVDFAPNAIHRARREARQRSLAGTAHFRSADVSRPDLLAGVARFDLLVDVGCLHGLTLPQLAGYAANVTRLARPGAVFLLYAFAPGLSRNGQRWTGIDVDELKTLLDPAFELVDHTVGEEVTAPRPSAWYTFRRTGLVS
jgi:SAM-dependent methyltransferase